MAQNVTFNINLKVNGKDVVQKVTMNVGELRHVIDEATSSSKKLAESLINFNQKVELVQNISGSVSQLSSTLNALTEESRSFGGAMATANTMAGKGGADFERLKEQVADLAKTVPVARDELANGLYQVISNGVPEDNWIEYLRQSARASVGGMADLGETVKVTSTVIKNYGLSWDAAGQIQDKIQLTAKNGVTSFEQLAQALPRVASQASSLGVGIDELMASFATLTGVSGNTAEVGTQLAAIFTALVKPSSEAAEMAQQMGIEFDAAAIKAAGGMGNFITQLDRDVKRYAQTSGMLEQEIYGRLFGSAESLRALTPLTNRLASKFQDNIAAMRGSVGTIDEAFSTMAATGRAKLQLLNNKLGEMSDTIQATVGNALPYLNFSSQVLVSASSVVQLAVSLQSLTRVTSMLSAATTAAGRAKAGAMAAARLLQAAYHGEAAGATTAAVATKALTAAVRGLLIATGVGVAVWALSKAIDYLTDSSDTATAATRQLTDSQTAARQAQQQAADQIAQTRSQMELSIAKLKDFKGSKEAEKKVVNEMNATYGETLGYYATVAQWYEALTANSEAYCNQMINEIRLRSLANKAADLHEQQSNLKYNPDGTLKKYSKQRQTRTVTHVGGTQEAPEITTKRVEIAGSSALEKANRQMKELHRQETAVRKEMRGIVADSRKIRIRHTAGYRPAAPAAPAPAPAAAHTPKATGTVNRPATEKDPLKGSIDYYEKEIERLRKEISATADEATAKQKQALLTRKEQALQQLKIRIGIEEAPGQEVKNALQQLQDQLQAAQADFDAAIDIEAKVKAKAKADELQRQIDTATHGKLTIEAEAEPSYTVQGSTEDKRLSYANAQSRAQRIQTDYETGLIGKKEAQTQIADLNKALAQLDAGLKPVRLELDAGPFDRTLDTVKQDWGVLQGIGSGIEGITDALQGNRNAWQTVSGAVSGALQVAEGISSVVKMIDMLAAATATATVATAATTAATTASATATVAEGTAQATLAAAKLPMIAANKAATASYMELAAAAYFAAHAAIPFAGFGIAAGFAGAAAAATKAIGAMAFATGGIVPGTERTGDRVTVRVNSGEMILNARQQARLFSIANGAAVYGAALNIGSEFNATRHTDGVAARLDRLRQLATESTGNATRQITLKVRGRDLIEAAGNELRSTRRKSHLR